MNKFNLIENANDSLEHALRHMGSIENDGLGNWKRIIVDLAHVVELLFKEKLRQIHPAFVFTNIDKYPSITAHTVSCDLACKRLETIGKIDFSKDALKAIKTAREKRNQIEHFEFSISEREANVLIGQVLLFIFDFSDKKLNLGWESLHLQEKKHPEFKKYTEFYNEYLKEAEVQIEEDEICVIECSSCHNVSFDVDKETCLVCSHHEDVLDCNWCSSPYIFSSCEYDESAELCPDCESKDGYASANCEKY
jgi:hypothetical protein